MQKGTTKKGFTLIELMVVIAIIGILIAIAVFSYSAMIEKTNTQICRSNQRAIKNIRIYSFMIQGKYGDNISDLEEVFSEIGFFSGSVNDLLCPSGGNYIFEADNYNLTCSIERHNL